MAPAILSRVFESLGTDTTTVTTNNDRESQYWEESTGSDLANMLSEADYPEEVRRRFLTFYRDYVCPQLGSRPDEDSAKSCIGRDGDCFEYSYEFKGSTKHPGVRFGVDLSSLRPVDIATPLSIAKSQKVIDEIGKRTLGFDDTWYRALVQSFVYAHLPKEQQNTLIEQAGHQTPLVVGFDIHTRLTAPDALPIMAKVYFPPCFAAAEKDITRWDAVRSAIRQLPQIESYPNILASLKMIEDYLSTKPKDFQHGVRYLATDFLVPGKTRLKIYMRIPGPSFEDTWDFYTLSGRIRGLEEDKEKFRDLIDFMKGTENATETQVQTQPSLTKARVKTTTIYFSLSAENPGPAPKIGFFPANSAKNDEVIARGLDMWLSKYGWYDGGKTLLERLDNVL
ncbi:MAG: hypothetical protein Q9195_004652 [Heterodermia aff. obscurata]